MNTWVRFAHSSRYDDNPRIWLCRAFAHLELGQLDDSLACFAHYEGILGPDLCARRMARALVPEEGGSV